MTSPDDTYDSCRRATGWKTYAELVDIQAGDYFCIRATAGRLASMKVTAVNESLDDQLIFVATVWETP